MAEELNIKKLDGKSLDVAETDKERLKAVFPQCFVEGKLDIDKLLSLCGEYIDNDFEKYKFEWKGKSECLRIAGKRSTGTLRPCPIESVDFENTNNLYIEGDNLEVLKLLQTAYYRKVKMIYIDPPYNTGNDFVYEDDFKDPLAKYKEITSQTTKSNPETMGRYHTNWLNMMYPRLRLAANLLRDDGVIFISIDDHEVTNLCRICDEVFGEENKLAILVWKKKYTGGKGTNTFADYHEYIVAYCKSLESLGEISMARPEEEKEKFTLQDEYVNERGKYYTRPLKSNLDPRPTLVYPIELPNGTTVTTQWICAKDTFEQLKKEGRIEFKDCGNSKYPVYKKFYEKDGGGNIKIPSFIEVSNNNEAKEELKSLFNIVQTRDLPFQTPKPTKLLSLFIENLTKDDDIILDFFSGSASCADAVMQSNASSNDNRQFIMVQLPEVCKKESEAYKFLSSIGKAPNICEIGKERIRRAGAKIKEQNADVDVGFKVLKLDTSNLVKWDDTPLASTDTADLFTRMDGMIESIKKGRSELDVVYEVMLKLGIPATYKVFENNLNGRKVYSIGDDGLILVCLDGSNGGITPEDVTAMCEFSPAKIVAAEEAFKDDVALSNAFYISKDSGVEIMLL
ncbi:MAG: site-specific DNA-methyltransferase [Alphaproteobacteria bacterium]|nr:site-specific DNA-methyltransferase [Alphaproteobacteria bacterium]